MYPAAWVTYGWTFVVVAIVDSNWDTESSERGPHSLWIWQCLWWNGREEEGIKCKDPRKRQEGKIAIL